jgi:predicted nucleic acid-binding protein
MKKYLFDSNILFMLERSETFLSYFKAHFGEVESPTHYITYITLGELKSMAHRNRWSNARKDEFFAMVAKFQFVLLESEEGASAYSEVEAYSQNRHPKFKAPDGQARKMGKNDIWIAAAAKLKKMTLVTADKKGFSHFVRAFLEVELIEVSDFKK